MCHGHTGQMIESLPSGVEHDSEKCHHIQSSIYLKQDFFWGGGVLCNMFKLQLTTDKRN